MNKGKQILIGIFVIVGIIVAYILVSPLFISTKSNEKIEDISGPTEITTQGTFVGIAGHRSGGTASLVDVDGETYVRFEDDFTVTNGPDLFVYFGKDNQYIDSARIAKLKASAGGQNYRIPENINPDDFNEVWVWCRAFSVPFAKAELK